MDTLRKSKRIPGRTTELIFEDSVQVNIPAESGEMGILANHVPAIEQLKPGLVEIIEEAGASKQFFRTSDPSSESLDISKHQDREDAGHYTNAINTQSPAVSPPSSPAPSSASTLLRATLLRTSAQRPSRTRSQRLRRLLVAAVASRTLLRPRLSLRYVTRTLFFLAVEDA